MKDMDTSNHRIKLGWEMEECIGVSCDRCIPIKLKGTFHRTANRPTLLYRSEYWATKKEHVNKIAEI